MPEIRRCALGFTDLLVAAGEQEVFSLTDLADGRNSPEHIPPGRLLRTGGNDAGRQRKRGRSS